MCMDGRKWTARRLLDLQVGMWGVISHSSLVLVGATVGARIARIGPPDFSDSSSDHWCVADGCELFMLRVWGVKCSQFLYLTDYSSMLEKKKSQREDWQWSKSFSLDARTWAIDDDRQNYCVFFSSLRLMERNNIFAFTYLFFYSFAPMSTSFQCTLDHLGYC